MSNLTIFQNNDVNDIILDTDDSAVIIKELGDLGVCFEHWDIQEPLPSGAGDQDVIAAYSADVERIKSAGGYNSVDVVRLAPNNAQKYDLRKKFLSEHTHNEDEVRFFVEGSGMFYLHVGGKVYMLLCVAGDLINVPANAPHWFDMGKDPDFTCIRLFTSKDGWAASYTGDDIADKFPKFDKKAA